MGFIQEKKGQAGLTDPSTDGWRQFSSQQSLMIGQF